MSRLPSIVAVPLLLGLFALLCVTSMSRKGATFDEIPHIAAGYTYLAAGDFRLNPEHPPLLKLLSASPLLLRGASFQQDWQEWRSSDQWRFGQRFLYDENDASRVIFVARLPVVLVGCLLGWMLWSWSRDLAGHTAAHLILLLYALTPDFLAHAQLVTTDLAVTSAIFGATYMAWRVACCWSWPRVLLMALGLGAALTTKFSSVVFVPVPFVYLAVRLLSAKPWPYHDWPTGQAGELVTFEQRFYAVFKAASALVLIPLLLIWACYGFQYTQPIAAGGAEIYAWNRVTDGKSLLAPALSVARVLHVLPEPYVYGFLYTLKTAQSRVAFLNGHYSDTGWWYYFLVTFFVKTPLPLIGAIIASLFVLPRRLLETPWIHLSILLPVGLYLLVTFTANLNIGHRHLLPVYPFLLLLLAQPLAQLLRWRAGPYITAAGLAWLACGTLAVHPHYLAYFNELAGGPRNGWRILVDSNLDWGQDLPLLKDWMDSEGVKKVHLSYFGTAVPEYYGINYSPLPSFPALRKGVTEQDEIAPGDMLAISATNLQKVYLGRNQADPSAASFAALADYLRSQQPIAQLGYTILVYRLPAANPAPTK